MISRLLFLMVLLSLAACTTVPVQAPEPERSGSWEEHVDALTALTHWQVQGRAAIRTGDQAGTVALNWRQRDESYRVELRAPWGAGNIVLDSAPRGVTLRTSKGVQEFATEPRELLWRHTGFDLPVEALRYWLLGLPEPSRQAELEVDERGLLTELHQHGWRIRYLDYGQFDGVALPTRLYVTGEVAEVRVAVQEWSLAE